MQEYIVWRTYDEAIDFFRFVDGDLRLVEIDVAVFNGLQFPGLWIDSAAMLRGDVGSALTTLQSGFASAGHQAFVKALAAKVSVGGGAG